MYIYVRGKQVEDQIFDEEDVLCKKWIILQPWTRRLSWNIGGLLLCLIQQFVSRSWLPEKKTDPR